MKLEGRKEKKERGGIMGCGVSCHPWSDDDSGLSSDHHFIGNGYEIREETRVRETVS